MRHAGHKHSWARKHQCVHSLSSALALMSSPHTPHLIPPTPSPHPQPFAPRALSTHSIVAYLHAWRIAGPPAAWSCLTLCAQPPDRASIFGLPYRTQVSCPALPSVPSAHRSAHPSPPPHPAPPPAPCASHRHAGPGRSGRVNRPRACAGRTSRAVRCAQQARRRAPCRAFHRCLDST